MRLETRITFIIISLAMGCALWIGHSAEKRENLVTLSKGK